TCALPIYELTFKLTPRLLQGHATTNQLIDDEEQASIQVLVGQGQISAGKGARKRTPEYHTQRSPPKARGLVSSLPPAPLQSSCKRRMAPDSPRIRSISRLPGECSRLSPLGGALAGYVHDRIRARPRP